VAEDDRRGIPVPELGQVVAVPPGAAVLDLPVDVAGTDAGGNDFVRRVHTNVVRLHPLSEWPVEASPAGPAPCYVCGRIDHAEVRDGLVVELRLSQATYSRTVTVDSPVLARDLAALDHPWLRDQSFLFGVRGDRLDSMFRPLPAGRRAVVAGEYGNEGRRMRGNAP
jgi:hypothetical protein